LGFGVKLYKCTSENEASKSLNATNKVGGSTYFAVKKEEKNFCGHSWGLNLIPRILLRSENL
jgi:hypothetical protein